MKWLKQLLLTAKKSLKMNSPDEFLKKIQVINTLLGESGKDPLTDTEITTLRELNSDGISPFDLSNALWNLRFNVFYMKVVSSFPEFERGEIEKLCKECFTNGLSTSKAIDKIKSKYQKSKSTPEVTTAIQDIRKKQSSPNKTPDF